MDTQQLRDWDREYLWHPFTAMTNWLDGEPLVIQRGEGVYLYDTDGNRYIDGVSSLWCNIHGHCHEHINSAIRRQLDKIAHSTLLGLANILSIELGKRLVEITPEKLTRVFYSDSGATSVEIAIKIAFQYWRNKGQNSRDKFIALKQSYHGDTMGSVSIGGIDLFHRIFGPMTFPAIFSESPHLYRFDGTAEQCRDYCLGEMDRLLREHAGKVAAIVTEPLVQGAGGIIVHPKGYLKGVEQLARKHGVLLITDEVATGFGRTGKMFACEHEDVEPDILCCAKGLTGGYLPLAATLVSDEVFGEFLGEPTAETTFYHGHTYTGNALGCAAAIASLEVFENEKTLEKLPSKIALIEKSLWQIAQMDYVGDVRQCGLMVGIELVADKATKKSFEPTKRVGAAFCRNLLSKGVLLRPLGDVIVVMPPLSISNEQLTKLMEVVKYGLLAVPG